MILSNEISELESYLDNLRLISTDVSTVDVGWHIDHVLRANVVICYQLIQSDNETPKRNYNLHKARISLTKSIPRGKKETHPSVSSAKEVTIQDVQRRLKTLKALLPKLEDCHPENGFVHQAIGWMNLEWSKKFMQIHTEHHLKIIRDIFMSVNREKRA